ncbi:PAS domain-containing sensor histidine kinase|uniref:histidine kinase n=1 Tax=Dendrosporobacter quercicolus TaxID=146817 RepID=A0A1G9ZH18_9FIRM|nr:ATP-binding protein [Dendrosporobacter quercicolus]NSL49815.1 PAS domain-containing sensor histidine kinase [Dendrosporobacter quercicolus DSM 1736]SDN20660.1 two-component system, NtrC family, sensor histidine kinase AtoS [Dendrosporobacter quercicolus]
MYSTAALSNKVVCLRDDEYKEYFEATTTGVIYLDGAMRIKNLNREAERICSTDRAKILGKRANVVFDGYGENFLKIFSIGEFDDLNTTNLKVKIKDQYVYLHVDTLKLLDSSGAVSGMIVIMQDVSAVRAAIKQIQTTQMLMSLGELAAGVAHHVRTPLTTISGYLQVMVNRLEDDKYTVRRDILETMLDEVSYINGVVKELVMFAKPAVEKQPGADINRVLEEALLLTFKQLGGEKITIQKQLAKDLPTICADSNLLQQAMVNIMQNAMEAMPEDGVLTVKSWLNAEINMLVIAIHDTGPGVVAEMLPRIFEPFYTTKLDRMGLGLPVAHRIVAEHGGFINISVNDNGGTKVHVYIPLFDDKVRHLAVVHQQILNLQ